MPVPTEDGRNEGSVREMKDKIETIGVYCVCDTMGICVHEIDYCEDRVLASANGENLQWCPMNEQTPEGGKEAEPGFLFGSFFVPFSEVMRV